MEEPLGVSRAGNCIICREKSSKYYPTSCTWTVASGVTLDEKLTGLFFSLTSDLFLESAKVCQICFELLEQLDLFEQNVINIKDSLRKRLNSRPNGDLQVHPELKVECKLETPDDVGNDHDIFEEKHKKLKRRRRNAKVSSYVQDDADRDFIDDGDQDSIDDDFSSIASSDSEKIKKKRKKKPNTRSSSTGKSANKDKVTKEEELGSCGKISSVEYDKLKLDLPVHAFPVLPKDILNEVVCSVYLEEFQSWEEKLEHVMNVHPNLIEHSFGGFKCPVDKVIVHGLGKLMDHLSDAHNFVAFDENFLLLNRDALLERDSDYKLPLDDNEGFIQCGICGLICLTEFSFSFHRKFHHKQHAVIPAQCPLCPKLKSSEEDPNNPTLDANPLSFDELRHHILRGHLGFAFSGKLSKLPNEVNPMSGAETVLRVGNVSKKLEDLHFKEYHDCLFYPEKTFEKLKEGDSFLDSFDSKIRNLLMIILSSVKMIPKNIATLEDRIKMDIIVLKCSIPTTKAYPKDAVCFECGQKYDNFLKRISHFIESHDRDTHFYLYCSICSERLSPGKEATKHMKQCHRNIYNSLKEDLSWKLGEADEERKIVIPFNEGLKYQCDQCSLLCGSEISYWYHLRTEHKCSLLSYIEEHSCKPCVQTKFDSEWSFFNHLMNKHGGFQYKCPVCSKGYNKNFMLKDHLKVHITTGVTEIRHGSLQKLSGKKSGLYQTESCICDICSKSLKSVRMLAQHKSNFHGIEVPCFCRVPKCGIMFQSFREESKHFRQVHQKFQTTCHICGKMLLGKGLLQKHIEAEHSDQVQKVVCRICSKELKSVQNLKNHMIIHDETHQGHKCSFCGKTHRWTKSLNSHIKAAHSVVYKSFECTDCGKVFKDPANFKAHRYTHSSVKPYNCEKCGKGFVRRDTWSTHTSSCNVLPNLNR